MPGTAIKRQRPKRKHIPIAAKREVSTRQGDGCKCGCGRMVRGWTMGTQREVWGTGIHWDHEPALRLRDVNRKGTDYIPRQNDPKYLVARCAESHKIKTIGAGTSRKRSMAGTDIGKITKERGRVRAAAAKPSRPVPRASRGVKGASGPQKRPQWVSRKIQSRPFDKTKGKRQWRKSC